MDENLKLPRRDRKHVAEAVMVEYIDYLKADYTEIEKYLSIETTTKDVLSGHPSEGEQTHILRAYQERLAELEMKNEALNRMVGALAEKLGMRDSFIEILGYDPNYDTGEVQSIPKDAKPLTDEEKEELKKLPVNTSR